MTVPAPSEFVNGKHWADVIGCDVRAGLAEIQRAAERRAREILDGPLRGEALAAKLETISEALSVASREKRARTRGPKPVGL